MLKWRGPEGWEVLEARSEPKPGGQQLHSGMGTPKPRSADDHPFEVTGASGASISTWSLYSLVRFTWNADWAPGEESMATVRLSDAEDGGTVMEFMHDRFLTPQSAAGHNQGWNSAFNKLDEVCGRLPSVELAVGFVETRACCSWSRK